jgi:hypothetical protein
VHITIPLYDHASPAEVAEILAELGSLELALLPRLSAPSSMLAAVAARADSTLGYIADSLEDHRVSS